MKNAIRLTIGYLVLCIAASSVAFLVLDVNLLDTVADARYSYNITQICYMENSYASDSSNNGNDYS